MLHPITYSLCMNLAVLAVAGFLAYHFSWPELVIIAVMLQSHSLARFGGSSFAQVAQVPTDDEDDPSIGFTARLRPRSATDRM